MSMHSIEPGQRLMMQAGEKSGIVEVLAEAVVPADYWLCRDDVSGQRRLVARTALFPIVADPAVADAAVADAPPVAAPVIDAPAKQNVPAAPAAQTAHAAPSETLPSAA